MRPLPKSASLEMIIKARPLTRQIPGKLLVNTLNLNLIILPLQLIRGKYILLKQPNANKTVASRT